MNSQLIITVGNGAFDVELRGRDDQLIEVLGGIEYAKNWLMQEILRRQNDPYCRRRCDNCEEAQSAYNKTTTVSKQEAMNAYLEARAILEQRLQQIVRADDRATFELPAFISQPDTL